MNIYRIKVLIIFFSIALTSCMPHAPTNDIFDSIEIQNNQGDSGLIHYKVNTQWLAWSVKTNVKINRIHLNSLQGNCEGEIEIIDEGYISYKKIIRGKSHMMIYFGEDNKIKCYVVDKGKSNSFSVSFSPIISTLPLFDPGEYSSDKDIEIPLQ